MPYILGIVMIATLLNPLIVDLYYLVRQSPKTGIWTIGRCTKVCFKSHQPRYWKYAGNLAMRPCRLGTGPLIFSESGRYANM